MGALAVCLLIFPAGCGGSEVDRAAWERDLAEHGLTVSDWSKFESAWERACDNDQDELEAFVAATLDAGGDPDVIRTNVDNACPDRADDVDQALDAVSSASDAVDLACRTPPTERTEEQQLIAEAMAC